MGLGSLLPSSTPDEPGTMPGAGRIYRSANGPTGVTRPVQWS